MQKQVHVNAYTKSDGTQVREHYRIIDTDDYRTPPIIGYPDYDPLDIPPKDKDKFPFPLPTDKPVIMNENPVLTGGVSVDVGFPNGGGGIDDILGSILGGIAGGLGGIVTNALPIVLQLIDNFSSPAGAAVPVDFNLPQFKTPIIKLNNIQNQMKINFENSVDKLLKTKNQAEYLKLYEPLLKEHQIYQKANNFINIIKAHAYNGDFNAIKQELGNFTEGSDYKNIISDLLKPEVKLQNNIPNFSYNMQNALNKMTLNEKLINTGSKMVSPHLKVAGSNLQNAMQNFKYANNNPHAHILNSRTEITNQSLNKLMDNVKIPKDSKGVIYDNNSEQSKLLWQSPEIQGFIKNNLQDLLSDNAKNVYDIEFIKRVFPNDNYYGLQHCKLFNPQITPDGYFKGIIVDYYDFVERTVNSIGDYINNWGYSMQEKGYLENIFNIYIIYKKL